MAAGAQGFFWLASHPGEVWQWSTAGRSSRFAPYGRWLTPAPARAPPAPGHPAGAAAPAGAPGGAEPLARGTLGANSPGDAADGAHAPEGTGAAQRGMLAAPEGNREQRLVFIGEALPQVPCSPCWSARVSSATGRFHVLPWRFCCTYASPLQIWRSGMLHK